MSQGFTGIYSYNTMGNDGWISTVGMTYSSADDPTYVMKSTADIDLTGVIGLGMRIKVTQATGGTKYFIVTKINYNVDVASRTAITLYGGTDYNLENEAIIQPSFSMMKTPFGFPVSPTKWSVVTNLADGSQVSPNASQYYTPGASTIVVPIGVWNFESHIRCYAEKASGTYNLVHAISTETGSVSDADMLIRYEADVVTEHLVVFKKTLTITTKTTYYPLIMTGTASLSNIQFLANGTYGESYMYAYDAYL